MYKNWETETFDYFDMYPDINKVFIELGGWIGSTCAYASRKSKHVYVVEADINSFNDLSNNLKINCDENYTIINKAIYNIDDIDIKFGKNMFINNSRLNDSTSQIIYDESKDGNTIKTMTLQRIINDNNIDPKNISLIKVDIEGGEENILEDLYDIHKKFDVPLYISFHYGWWKNKDLGRFKFLTEKQKYDIQQNPFISILFSKNNRKFKIAYGTDDIKIDITNICYNKLLSNNIIKIPDGDTNRANIFTDPLSGVLKKNIYNQ